MSGPPPAWRSGSRSHTDALAFGMKDQSMFPDVINFVFVGVLFSLPGCCMSLPIVGVALILCLTDCNHSHSPVQYYMRWHIWSLAQCYLSEFQRCPKAKSHRYLCSLLCIFKKIMPHDITAILYIAFSCNRSLVLWGQGSYLLSYGSPPICPCFLIYFLLHGY